MTRFNEIFNQAVKNASKTQKDTSIWTGTVSEVTEDTCTVEPYPNVRLNATIEGENYTTLVPKEGSTVVVGRLENTDELVVLKTSEVDKIIVKIGVATLLVDENTIEMNSDKITFKSKNATMWLENGKFTIKSGNVNLKDLLTDLLGQLQNAVVLTAQGPANFSPVDKAVFSQIQNKLNNLLT